MNETTSRIRPLAAADYPAFFAYLDEQLAENGKRGQPLFQPVSRDVVRFPAEKESTFVAGLGRALDQPGWRRAWLALDAGESILGHVDLRAHAESGIHHRALLGMGVARTHRRRGVARHLLDFVMQWMRQDTPLVWLDIEVMAGNAPALALYRKSGFEQLAQIEDMFRIDGRPEAVIRMARKIT